MENITQALGEAAHQFSLIQPMLGTYVHVLLSALFAIYTGAHASLTRPISAAKPAKQSKKSDEDDEEEPSDNLQKMEGLSPTDAIMFPILAGATLAGLYFLIKWLEDPTILNKILNWYFTVFGVLGLAKLFTDAMGVLTSAVFPARYVADGQLWEIKPKQRVAKSTTQIDECSSPLPGWLSKIRLTPSIASALWTLRELPSKRIHVRAYVHKLVAASVHIGPQGCLGFLLALVATLYFNLIGKPWWLTNVLGYSFAYAFLQLMSPTTFSTGSLILAALFVYDIYFVFFTPLMVTVATQLDIPAKMLFPRPPRPDDDPAKQSLAMLGLGDIVLPGLVIGFALRFDLYLFYLHKQRPRMPMKSGGSDNTEKNDDRSSKTNSTKNVVKAPYQTASGGWGERFWVGKYNSLGQPINGGIFPKTYFYACIYGYIAGMITTLSVMSIYGHAQPALLYLVPGVLGSLWGTALIKGDLKTMWDYDESEPEDAPEKKPDEPKKTLKSIFSWSRQDEIAKRIQGHANGDAEKKSADEDEKKGSAEGSSKKGGFFRDRKTEIIFFAIDFPGKLSSEAEPLTEGKTSEHILKPKPTVENELQMAFEGGMADTPPSTRTRSMRKSMLNGGEPPEKRMKRA